MIVYSKNFYVAVGKHLTACRQQRKLSISTLGNLVGQQYKTIKAIEDGNPFYAHHFEWMFKELKMDINKILADIEGGHNEQGRVEDYV